MNKLDFVNAQGDKNGEIHSKDYICIYIHSYLLKYEIVSLNFWSMLIFL